jgi:hypothetical protein
VAFRCANYGAVFIGHGAAEVLGDYGAVSLTSPLGTLENAVILEQPLI